MVTQQESRGRWKFGCRSRTQRRKLAHETESKTGGGSGGRLTRRKRVAQLSWNISTVACSCCCREHSTSGSLRNSWEKPLAQQHLQEVGIFIKSRTDPSTHELQGTVLASALVFPAIYSNMKHSKSSAKFLFPLHHHVKKLRHPAQPSRTGRALLLPQCQDPQLLPAPFLNQPSKPWLCGHRLGYPKGKSHPPGTQQLPIDLIPCIFSFSRAFSSTSRSKAVVPFSSEPPPGS